MNKQASNLKNLRREIEKHFAANSKKAYNYKQIAALFDITSNQGREAIIRIIKTLEKENIIEEISPGKYIALFVTQFIEGRIQLTQRGIGFLLNESGSDDILIENDHLNTALDGDTVKVHLFAHKSNGKQTGEVIEVINRKRTDFVGVIQVSANYAFLILDDKKMYTDIFIPINKINKAKNGDKAVAKIVEWNAEQKNPIGEIIEILGKPGEHHTEMHAIIAEFGFSVKFPDAVEKEADKIPLSISQSEIDGRRDF